jgi:hypothetical protein
LNNPLTKEQLKEIEKARDFLTFAAGLTKVEIANVNSIHTSLRRTLKLVTELRDQYKGEAS